MNRYHHSSFSDLTSLASVKSARGHRVSVCIPTLDEADTIGEIVTTIVRKLCGPVGLVDEVLVIDSGSSDDTLAIAQAAGATVRIAADILPEHGCHHGKGENLWKALHEVSGDIICYIDGDISNFHPGFVTGLIGPLLTERHIDYVKAYYQRPLACGDDFHSQGGGRVSEILVRPMLSMFYPALSGVLQPLAGEYAARRALLRRLPFPTGYGVEIAHLIDLHRMGLLHRLAQTDLDTRHHRNRGDAELGDTAFAILRVMLRRLERDGLVSLHHELPELHLRWSMLAGKPPLAHARNIPEPERPPHDSEQPSATSP